MTAKTRPPPLPRAAAGRYWLAMRSLMGSWRSFVLAHPGATYSDLNSAWAHLTEPRLWSGLFRQLAVQIENEVGRYYARVLKRKAPSFAVQREKWIADQFGFLADIGQDQVSRLVELGPRRDARTDAREASAVTEARKADIALIKGTTLRQHMQLIETFKGAQAQGVRHETLVPAVQEILGIGVNRAKLIARDQTVKHNAAANQAQAQAAGITEYTWRATHDQSTRPMHAELDGKVFRYDSPPVTNEDGEKNNPGEDYNCRCQAEPVIPGSPGFGAGLFAGLEEPTFEGLGF